MPKKLFALSFALLLGLPLLSLTEKTTKNAEGNADRPAVRPRWEGVVVRTNRDLAIITVRKFGSSPERVVYYDPSTKFTAQQPGTEYEEDIGADDIKEDDRIICMGYYDGRGKFHATRVSKRLLHSPK